MYPYIQVFGREIPSYGLLLLIGFAISWCLIVVLSKAKPKFNKGDIGLTYLICLCGGLVGAYFIRPVIKLAEIFIHWEEYRIIPSGELLNYIFGDIVFLGGFLGGAAALFIFCRHYKINIIPLTDLYAPALALGHAIGRLGCLAGGCCYGIEVSPGNPFSVIYPSVSLGAPSGVPLLAAPLIESAFLFALSILLTVLYLKGKTPGLCGSLYLILYPIERFIIEFYRGDLVRGKYGLFTTSQYISMLVFIFGVGYLVNILRKKPLNLAPSI